MDQSESYEAVQHAELRLLEAIRINDIAHLDYLLHDELLFIDPSGQTVTKMMDLEKYRAGNFAVTSLTAGEPEIQVIGDVAVVVLETVLEANYNAEAFSGRFRYLRVWRDFGTEWKVVAGSCVRIPDIE